jgi:hypothetical protein
VNIHSTDSSRWWKVEALVLRQARLLEDGDCYSGVDSDDNDDDGLQRQRRRRWSPKTIGRSARRVCAPSHIVIRARYVVGDNDSTFTDRIRRNDVLVSVSLVVVASVLIWSALGVDHDCEGVHVQRYYSLAVALGSATTTANEVVELQSIRCFAPRLGGCGDGRLFYYLS